MKTVRRHTATLNLPTLRLEGGLFLPDVLAKAAHGSARLQTEADYRLPKGLQFKDEIGRAFQIASAQWRSFAPLLERADYDPQHAAATFITELLRDALGYPAVGASTGITVGEGTEARHYPITHLACAPAGADGQPARSLPIVVASHTQGLDEADTRFAITGSGSRKKTPFQLAQELLNASPAHQWALVTNGKTLRLLRDAATLTRPSYLEFDLQDLLGGQRLAEFAFAWRLLHASRAGLLADAQGSPAPIAWEAWREAGQEEGTRVRNGLRNGVTQALITLGQGFVAHPDNHALRQALQDGSLSKEAYFAQLLRLIYRCIFTFSVEERGLIPAQPTAEDALADPAAARAKVAAAQAYAQGYALARLRDMALRRRARTRFDDLWHGIKIVFHGLGQGQPRLGLPALGGLFASTQCPHLDAAQLSNAHLLATMQALRWAPTPGGGPLAPIDYRNMGTEELGSVYESLLELVPEVDLHARHFGFVGLTDEGSTSATVAGNDRKLTGSYYTPDSLVQQLIHSALDPVIEQRLAQNAAQPVEALLAIRVIDPACGSGHFLLAAARRLAEKLAQLRAHDQDYGAVTPQAYRHALREVVGRCIFGVDRNPMALELARTALWLEGFEEGRPLGFLDHHLQCGDALLGLTDLHALERGIAKDAFKPLSGDDKNVCKQLAKQNAAGLKQLAKDLQGGQQLLAFASDTGLHTLRTLEALGADTPDDVAAKAQAYRQFCEQLTHSPLALAADLAVGAYLLPKTPESATQVPTSETLHTALTAPQRLAEPGHDHSAAVAAARTACRQARVLHWPLAFPLVYAAGGFDCVLGNPPWERIKLQEEEFFATRHPAVATAKNKAERTRHIDWLREGTLAQQLASSAGHPPLGGESEAEQRLYAEFISARRTAEATSVFMHVDGSDGGRYPLTGVGDVNTYALFAETILQITAPTGRGGFIVPSGIATDDSTKRYFQRLVGNAKLVSLFGFDNARRIFPAVHPDTPFSLVTIGTSKAPADLAHYVLVIDQLNDPRRRFTLTPDEFRLINPNTLTCPVFRSSRDAELTKKLYRASPVLIREAVWAGEGKQAKCVSPEVNPWGISFMRLLDMANDSGLFKSTPAPDRLPLYEAKLIHQFDHRWATYTPDGDSRDLTLAEKQDPATTVTPRYWVEARDVWLRVSTLPEGLRKALRDGNPDAALLCATQLLFGWHLAEARRHNPAVGTYTAWQAFVRQHPYANEVAPVGLGLCGNSPAVLEPQNHNYLPGQGLVEVFMSNEFKQSGWFAVDAQAEQAVLAFTAHYRSLPTPTAPLQIPDDVQALAERWLQAACPQWLMGWRDITNATNERTVIASVVPLAGVGHTMPLFFTTQAPAHTAALLGNLGALVLDFCARVKVGGTHLTYGYFKQFPVLPPDRYTEADLAFIVPRVLELTYTAHDLAGWAHDLGHDGPPFPFHPERRAQLRAELDAYYARLYGLTRDELRYILDPADVMGEDYPSETFRVLKNKELRDFGEYRTQRLVLAAWDAGVASPVAI
ncbi:Eco57I restriction-modification methylase domain-containing protein [Acidovorax carolinensis]|uniref:Eco57I restriction-modification methylase domain-containing protein n=1 Tax=Acidovorax carolinensis TaxID=553814 RepID=UPI000B344634|nr:N-6 DNA methylase [Acidovorax carolinensis]ART48743.1 restriction endonuclease [Acidovorax carolinensis]